MKINDIQKDISLVIVTSVVINPKSALIQEMTDMAPSHLLAAFCINDNKDLRHQDAHALFQILFLQQKYFTFK